MIVRLAQLDRAFGYGPKGRGFESSNAREEKEMGMCCAHIHLFLFSCGSHSNGFVSRLRLGRR